MMLAACPRYAGAASGYDPSGRRDPFVPLVGVAREVLKAGEEAIAGIRDIAVQGIVINPDGTRNVIINNEVLEEGETSGRLFVESIGTNGVTIRLDGKRYELKLYE